VIIGTSDLTNFNGDAQRIQVEKIIPYDLYDPTNASRTHDIATKFFKELIIVSFIQPTKERRITHCGSSFN